MQALRGELPEWIALPSSVTLPFCCFEQALDDPANKDVKAALLTAAKRVPDSPAKHLHDCRCCARCRVPHVNHIYITKRPNSSHISIRPCFVFMSWCRMSGSCAAVQGSTVPSVLQSRRECLIWFPTNSRKDLEYW